ncbi:MAG: hypothetical protein ABI552_02995 [Casimicrobiaceae bacterium]
MVVEHRLQHCRLEAGTDPRRRRIAAAAGLLWLGILVALSLADFLARGH